MSAEYAFHNLARRTGLLEIKIFVMGLLIQRQTGGSMTSLLNNLSSVVRKRFQLESKISSLTAEGRMQAWILIALPVLLYGAMLIVNRPYALKLFNQPIIPIAALISVVIGSLWIKTIIRLK